MINIGEAEDRLYFCKRCGSKILKKSNEKYCFHCQYDMKKLYHQHANETARKTKKWLEEIRK